MSRPVPDPLHVLATLDPARSEAESLGDPASALATILATPRPAATTRPVLAVRRRVVLAGAAAMVLAVAALVALDAARPGSSPAYAATPPMLRYELPTDPPDAAELLRQIAAAAERSEVRGSGGYEYLHIKAWGLTHPEFMNRGRWSLDPYESQEWRRMSDDSGRTIYRRLDEPWVDDEHAASTYGPGELPAFPFCYLGRAVCDQDLTSDAEVLRSLVTGTGIMSNAGGFSPLGVVAHLAERRVLPPAVRAQLWRIVAELPGISYAGRVIDRAGRSGEAFSMPFDAGYGPARDTLILDPATGELLGFERVLESITDADHFTRTLEHSGVSALTIQTPAVVQYTSLLAAELRPTDR